MKKDYVNRIHDKLANKMDQLDNGDINYSELGEYVYDVVGEDLLNILADLLDGEVLEN